MMRVYVEMTYRTQGGSEMQFNDIVDDVSDLDEGHQKALASLKADKRRRVDRVVYSRACPYDVSAETSERKAMWIASISRTAS